jgi:predicted O-methyltransferase YrrM
VKRATVRAYARRFGARTLVETGTYLGDMVEAMKDEFDRIYSIELGEELYRKACQRFRDYPEIVLLRGDSADVLPKLVPKLDGAILFWLDGHWSEGITARGRKETPIVEEVECILRARNPGHVILVDDARLFGTNPAYPTLDEVRRHVHSIRPQMDLRVEADIMRVTPEAFGSQLGR